MAAGWRSSYTEDSFVFNKGKKPRFNNVSVWQKQKEPVSSLAFNISRPPGNFGGRHESTEACARRLQGAGLLPDCGGTDVHVDAGGDGSRGDQGGTDSGGRRRAPRPSRDRGTQRL